MSGFSKYTCRIVNLDTGEVRELKNPECGFTFWSKFNLFFKFFLGYLISGEVARLRVDITKI